jgi:hypothetical protein
VLGRHDVVLRRPPELPSVRSHDANGALAGLLSGAQLPTLQVGRRGLAFVRVLAARGRCSSLAGGVSIRAWWLLAIHWVILPPADPMSSPKD